MNKRIRKKQEKQRKQLEMKWLLDMAVAIDTAIQEYWQWRDPRLGSLRQTAPLQGLRA